jgi:hypothetical protein
MSEHPLISSLVQGRLCEGIDDAEEVTSELPSKDVALPISADSSQLAAIYESISGKSFVLHGPPGTGKSQTITNIISNALFHGKRVLFVAEKMAALEVVQRRLAAIGLDPFCLELHSNKMEKRLFLEQLNRALEVSAQSDGEEYRRKADELYVQRLQLIGYVEALHRKHEQSGLSLSDCIERYLSAEALPMAIEKKVIEKLSEKDAHALRDKILMLNSAETILGMPVHDHPLYGMLPKRKPEAKKGAYVSPLLGSDTIEKHLPTGCA